MIETLREAFIELLDENDWMDDDTRLVAKEKVTTVTIVTALEIYFFQLF